MQVYRVFQKKYPPLHICWQFIFTCIYQFLKIYLNISSNGVNFSTTTPRFHPLKFSVGLFIHKMKMHLFGNDIIFRHRVS